MKKIVFCGFALSLLSACATTLTSAGGLVREADMNQVAKCEYVGDFTGSKYSGVMAVDSGIEDAKTEAKNKAGDKGATHIVWGNVSTGAVQSVSAKGYKCK